jgi:hypothetical protein
MKEELTIFKVVMPRVRLIGRHLGHFTTYEGAYNHALNEATKTGYLNQLADDPNTWWDREMYSYITVLPITVSSDIPEVSP